LERNKAGILRAKWSKYLYAIIFRRYGMSESDLEDKDEGDPGESCALLGDRAWCLRLNCRYWNGEGCSWANVKKPKERKRIYASEGADSLEYSQRKGGNMKATALSLALLLTLISCQIQDDFEQGGATEKLSYFGHTIAAGEVTFVNASPYGYYEHVIYDTALTPPYWVDVWAKAGSGYWFRMHETYDSTLSLWYGSIHIWDGCISWVMPGSMVGAELLIFYSTDLTLKGLESFDANEFLRQQAIESIRGGPN
jgi:hypothetical protein